MTPLKIKLNIKATVYNGIHTTVTHFQAKYVDGRWLYLPDTRRNLAESFKQALPTAPLNKVAKKLVAKAKKSSL